MALYARVSSDRQDVDLSVAAQLRALRDYAEKNGYLVVREYVDEGESGKVADRPQFSRMLDEAGKQEAPFKEILVRKFSRFTRKREHAVVFKSMLRCRGICVVSITEQADDTPTGKLMEAIIESVEEFYRRIWHKRLREECGKPPLAASGNHLRPIRQARVEPQYQTPPLRPGPSTPLFLFLLSTFLWRDILPNFPIVEGTHEFADMSDSYALNFRCLNDFGVGICMGHTDHYE